MTQIAATQRTDTLGKGSARRLRGEGRIPAVVYGRGEEATSVHIDPRELLDIYKATGDRNTVLQLVINDGEPTPVIVRDVQRHPLSRELLHIDFLKVFADRPIEVMVPIGGRGRAQDMSIGGRLRLIRREIRVRCPYTDIPSVLEADITAMSIGDMLDVSNLDVPASVTVLADPKLKIMTLYGKRK
jgi:large subunit ribosomal protein L25